MQRAEKQNNDPLCFIAKARILEARFAAPLIIDGFRFVKFNKY